MQQSLFIRACIACIRAYQHTLSPDHGIVRVLFPAGVCRYSPTCSEYMIQSVSVHGLRGFIFGIQRLARCHPFTAGGYDPIKKV